MQIFNSLGSNYSLKFSLFALKQLLFSTESSLDELNSFLENKFLGKAFLFFKGRDAIEFVLKSYGIKKGDQVLTQAFSCFAVEEAISRTGAEPVFVDLEENSVNFSLKTIKIAYSKVSNVKAVLVQHLLGASVDVKPIKKWCKENNLILIEDLAQSFGANYPSGGQLGSLADCIVLSFGRDKIVDGVSGGAAILKSEISESLFVGLQKRAVSSYIIVKDMCYPIITWFIRSFYSVGIGKIIHFFARKTQFLGTPTFSPTSSFSKLPKQYASLILRQLSSVENEHNHRRQIANYYSKSFQDIKKNIKIITNDNDIKFGSNLRFSFSINSPQKLINFLSEHNIYLADRWYRAPVDCGSLDCQTSYKKGSSQRAESLSASIINLPTHHYINIDKASFIVKVIKKYITELN